MQSVSPKHLKPRSLCRPNQVNDSSGDIEGLITLRCVALSSNRIGPCIHIACTQLPNAEPVCTSSPCGADGVSRLLFTLCKPEHHFRRRYCSAQRVSNAGPHPDLRQPHTISETGQKKKKKTVRGMNPANTDPTLIFPLQAAVIFGHLISSLQPFCGSCQRSRPTAAVPRQG